MSDQTEQQTIQTIEAIIATANMAMTDPGVVAGVLKQATPEERASANTLADVVQLFFKVAARVHAEVSAEVEEGGNLPPKVDLKDFETTLARFFRGPGVAGFDDDVEDVEFTETHAAPVTLQ